MDLINNFKEELIKFCDENRYSFDKLYHFPRCGNKEMLFIQRVDKSKVSKLGLANPNKKPAEILLSVIKNGEGVDIIKGENADKYLSSAN